jgi:hypothetical protein
VCLRIEIVQIAEGARSEEGVADIANGSFDAPFLARQQLSVMKTVAQP